MLTSRLELRFLSTKIDVPMEDGTTYTTRVKQLQFREIEDETETHITATEWQTVPEVDSEDLEEDLEEETSEQESLDFTVPEETETGGDRNHG